MLREGPEAGAGLCSWVPPGQLAGNSLRAGLRQYLLQTLAHVCDTPENTTPSQIQAQVCRQDTTQTHVSAFTRTHPIYPQIQSGLP